MTLNSTKNDMIEAPFLKKLIRFAIPVVLTGLLQCFYNAADTAIVGSLRGETALAAVGSTGALNGAIVNLFMGLSVGAGVSVARAFGANDDKKAQNVIHSSLILALILGVFVGVFGFFLARPLLAVMDTPDTVIDLSTVYMQINFLAMPASLIYNYCAAILRSADDAKRPLYFLLISGAVNVLLNVLFVAVFGMSVDGVAIATVISQYLSATLIVTYMVRSREKFRISIKNLRLDTGAVKEILLIGIPSGIQTTLFSLSNVLIQSSINSFGELTMAGNSASANLESFIHTSMVSMYHASLAFVGQNMGAKRYDNVKRVAFNCIFLVSVIGIGVSAIIALFRIPLLGLYTDSDDVLRWATYRMLFMLPIYPLCGIMDVTGATLRAMGRSITAMVNALLGSCAFRIIWVSVIFNFVSRDIGWIYAAFGISYVIGIILNSTFIVVQYRNIKRKEGRMALDEAAI